MSLLKKPKSYEEQIKLLRHKNLCINDEDVAKGILKQTGYYRLSGYYSFFYKTSDNSKKFMEGTTIEEVYNRKRVIIIRIEKKQDSLYTKGTLNLAFYLQFS